MCSPRKSCKCKYFGSFIRSFFLVARIKTTSKDNNSFTSQEINGTPVALICFFQEFFSSALCQQNTKFTVKLVNVCSYIRPQLTLSNDCWDQICSQTERRNHWMIHWERYRNSSKMQSPISTQVTISWASLQAVTWQRFRGGYWATYLLWAIQL